MEPQSDDPHLSVKYTETVIVSFNDSSLPVANQPKHATHIIL